METIKFNKENGPITIEVCSGFATLGTFILASSKKSESNYLEFGKDPKRIDDAIEDMYPIPIALDQITDYNVIIIGKYSPSPRSTQIKVTYLFIQKNEEIYRSEIAEISTESFKRYTHQYDFIEILKTNVS